MYTLRLDHLAVTVSDMERSLHFYCDLLGLRRDSEHDLEGETISRMAAKPRVRMKVVRLICPETPAVKIDLQQYLEPRGKHSDSSLGDVANSHFCFVVPDIWKAYRELTAKGVRFVSEPVCFNLDHEGKIQVVFLHDPDGFVLEMVDYSS